MPDAATTSLMCAVAFVDLVGYSTRSISEQLQLRDRFAVPSVACFTRAGQPTTNLTRSVSVEPVPSGATPSSSSGWPSRLTQNVG